MDAFVIRYTGLKPIGLTCFFASIPRKIGTPLFFAVLYARVRAMGSTYFLLRYPAKCGCPLFLLYCSRGFGLGFNLFFASIPRKIETPIDFYAFAHTFAGVRAGVHPVFCLDTPQNREVSIFCRNPIPTFCRPSKNLLLFHTIKFLRGS